MRISVTRQRSASTWIALASQRLAIRDTGSSSDLPVVMATRRGLTMAVLVLGTHKIRRIWRVIGVQVNVVDCVIGDHKSSVIDDVVREP